MATVLVIRKPDKTIHKVPLDNKAALISYNNRLPAGLKWKFEEIEEEEAMKLPFIDESYVTVAEAQDKANEFADTINRQAERLKELEALLGEKAASVSEGAKKTPRSKEN